MNGRPLFIVGSGRCGTSMLLRIINRFTSIAIPSESHFIPVFKQKLHQYGDLKKKKNILKLIKDIGKFPYVRDWDMEFKAEVIAEKVKQYSYAGILNAIYFEYAQQHGKSRWGDKTPWYLRCMSELAELFPNAQFIHIIRDGRDCALSVIECTWGPKNIYKASLWWKEALENGFREIEKLKKKFSDISNIYLEVRYEEILEDPKIQLKKIFEFIGERFNEQIISEFHIKRDNKEMWKSQMSLKQRKLFERVAGDVLKKLEYPTEFENLKAISHTEKIMYLIDNRIKSVKNIWWDLKRKWYGTMVPEKRNKRNV